MKIYSIIIILLLVQVLNINEVPISASPTDGPTAISRDGTPDDYAKIEWEYGLGRGIAMAQAISDTDGDGNPELVVGTYNGFVRTLEYRSGGLVIERKSDIIDPDEPLNDIYSLTIADPDKDGKNEVLVGSLRGHITVFDESTFSWESNTSFISWWIDRMFVEDVDEDGTNEIIYHGQAGNYVRDALTYALEWKDTNNDMYSELSDVAVADIDMDGHLEILTTNCTGPVQVLDGVSKSVEWTNNIIAAPFLLGVGDVDEDGYTDFVVSTWSNSETVLYIYNGTSKALKRQIGPIPTTYSSAYMKVMDMDGDGGAEILVTNGTGHLFIYNGSSSIPEHSFSQQDLGFDYESHTKIQGMVSGDIDKDGSTELILTSSANDEVLIVDPSTFAVEWKNNYATEMARTVLLMDVTNDGVKEIITGGLGRVIFRDGKTHGIIANLTVEGRVVEMRVADIDSDGDEEILVATNAKLYSFDPVALAEEWADEFGSTINALAVGETDNNGFPEIVVGVGANIRVLFGKSHALKKEIITGQFRTDSVEIGDVDSDGTPEIVAGIEKPYPAGGVVFIYNGINYSKEWENSSLGDFPDCIGIQDIDEDGIPELIIGAESGYLTVFDGITKESKGVTKRINRWLQGLLVADTDGDGSTEMLAGDDFGFMAISNATKLDAKNYSREWLSQDLGDRVEDIAYGDPDNDRQMEVLVAAGGILYMLGVDGTLSDYIVRDLKTAKVNPTEDEPVEVSVIVENVGTKTESSRLVFTDDRVVFAEETIPSLAPGQQTTVTKTWHPLPGQRTLKAKVWPKGDVDWTNNAARMDVYVNWKPRANLSVDRTEALTQTLFTFSDNGSFDDGQIVSFTMDFGDGNISDWGMAHIWSHTYSEDGNYTARLKAKDDLGVEGDWSAPLNITVGNRPPHPDFAYEPGNGTVLTELEFRSTSYDDDGTVVDWRWEFGDGTVKTGLTARYLFSDDINYTVNLTILDNDGAEGAINHTIRIGNIPPRVSFNASHKQVMTLETVHFDAANTSDPDDSKGALSFIWDFGDGGSQTGNPIADHIYEDDGVYVVTLTVVDDDKAANESTAVIGVLNRPPTANLTVTPSNGTVLTMFSFKASAADPDGKVVAYQWFIDGQKNPATKAEVSYLFSTNGRHVVNLTVKDDDNGFVTISKELILENLPPTMELTEYKTKLLTGQEVKFEVEGNDEDGTIVLYRWDFNGDGKFDKEGPKPSIKHAFTKPGKYTMIVEAVDNEGKTTTRTLDVVVDQDYTQMGIIAGAVVAIVVVSLVLLLVLFRRRKNKAQISPQPPSPPQIAQGPQISGEVAPLPNQYIPPEGQSQTLYSQPSPPQWDHGQTIPGENPQYPPR